MFETFEGGALLNFGFGLLGFVSDFEIRISDLANHRVS